MMEDRIAVLVVENEVLVRMDVVTTLEEEGFEVFQASNAAEALEILRVHGRIHALFTDIDMSGTTDGIRLVAFVIGGRRPRLS